MVGTNKNKIFVLDIGTRSVIGLVAEEKEEGLEIIASEYIEHKQRAMIDGQIHDVEQVSKVVKKIKECLERKIETPLKQVAVAAAGRALKTVRTSAFEELGSLEEINREKVLGLELSAVQEAQKILLHQEDSKEHFNYHCVGYSVVYYELDGDRIGNLNGQKGRNIGVEILATFLPRVVVDSLFSVLQRADLEMMSLTLEPIAASMVVIPPNMRMLNVALVDIGAGTSDIAISANGSIVGYEMVPMAGDEITEKICEKYLLDFGVGEIVKRELTTQKEILFANILGKEQRVASHEIIDFLDETVSTLAKEISEKILLLNQKPPQAVICIGGGSLTPLLPEKLAGVLELSPDRVAVRGREIISSIEGEENLNGPVAVTPIGIVLTAYNNQGLGFSKVTVNNQVVRLFEVNRGTVADSLLAAGINMKKVYPRLGKALTVSVNGKLKIIRGTKGSDAVIQVNGQTADLETPVQSNDVIYFEEAVNGQDATGCIRDVINEPSQLTVHINGKTLAIKPLILMNDQVVDLDDELVNDARITCDCPDTLGMVLSLAGMEHINESGCQIIVNGREANFDQIIYDDDEITVIDGLTEGFSDVVKETETIEESDEGVTTLFVNDEQVVIPRKNIIFADVLTYINFSVNPPGPGSILITQVNGISAEFTTPLKDADRVSLYWQQL